MSGSVRIASTAVLSPLTTLRMPAGRPASIISSARRIGTDGSRSEGFRMKALPQAIAGANIHIGIIAGEVEGRDAGADADRLAHRVHVDRGACPFGKLTLLQMRDAADELADFEAAHDIALGVIDRLAMLLRKQLGKLVHVAVQKLDELEENARAALRVGRRPLRLGSLGVLDGGAEFLDARQRQRRLHFAGCGVVDVARAPARACHMFAANKVTDLTHGSSPPQFFTVESIALQFAQINELI